MDQFLLQAETDAAENAVASVGGVVGRAFAAIKLFGNFAAELNLLAWMLLAEELLGVEREVRVKIQTFLLCWLELFKLLELGIRRSVGLTKGSVAVRFINLHPRRHLILKRAVADVVEQAFGH